MLTMRPLSGRRCRSVLVATPTAWRSRTLIPREHSRARTLSLRVDSRAGSWRVVHQFAAAGATVSGQQHFRDYYRLRLLFHGRDTAGLTHLQGPSQSSREPPIAA